MMLTAALKLPASSLLATAAASLVASLVFLVDLQFYCYYYYYYYYYLFIF